MKSVPKTVPADIPPLAAIILTPWLALLSSPLFPRLGVWYQSEPLIVGLFALGFLSALGPLLGLTASPRRAAAAIVHPTVIIPVVIFLWSVASMPFIRFPVLSFYGAPQTGFGAGWFLSMAAMTAGFRFLFLGRAASLIGKALSFYLLAAVVAVTLLGVYGKGDWKPFFFTDYLAFVAFFAGLTLWVMGPCAGWFRMIVVVICSGAVLMSENRVAYVALAVMPVLFFGTAWFVRRNFTYRTRIAAGALPGAILIALTAFVFLFNEISLFKELPASVVNTLQSRSLMLEVAAQTVTEAPSSLLTGMGWGTFTDALLLRLPFLDTTLFNYSANINDPLWFWDALWRLDFDSHNLFSETVLGGGLPSALLVLIWIGAIVGCSKRRFLPAVAAAMGGFVLISSLWFQMPLSVPYMALAVAAASGPGLMPSRIWRFGPPLLAVGTLATLFVMAAAVADYTLFTTKASRVVDENVGMRPLPNESAKDPLVPDKNRGQYHFSELMGNHVRRVAATLNSDAPVRNRQIRQLERFMAEADKRFKGGAPVQVGIRALNARADLAFIARSRDLGPAFQARLQSWGGMLDVMLSRYPQRSDLAVAYYLWLLREKREDELLQRAETLLQRDGRSPIGLWFSGVVLLGDKKKAPEGLQRLRRAVQNGIERFMPVDANLKKLLQKTPMPGP